MKSNRATATSTLSEALDAGSLVQWKTSRKFPFTPLPDPGAVGGSVAAASIQKGQTSWLEATVEGPGVFDFWLRGVEGSNISAQLWSYWSLSINGKRAAIRGTAWKPQWVLGKGKHRIRLTLHHPKDSNHDSVAGAVDQVSWLPMQNHNLSEANGASDLKFKGSGSSFVAGLDSAGRHGGSAIALNIHPKKTAWTETTVQGPCELSWDSFLPSANLQDSRHPTMSLLVDGTPLPMKQHDWQRMRVSLPAGKHVVRWSCSTRSYDSPVKLRAFDSVWILENFSILKGIGPLATALDSDDIYAFESADTSGALIQVDGENAWQTGENSSLYLFHPTRSGVIKTYWKVNDSASGVWHLGDEQGSKDVSQEQTSDWQEHSTILRPAGYVQWSRYTSSTHEPNAIRPLLQDVSIEEVGKIVSLTAGTDLRGRWKSSGWTGRKSELVKGEDYTWSAINRSTAQNTAELTVRGPARLSFAWKTTGTGDLTVSLDGGLMPVAEATGTWNVVTFDINPGDHLVRWTHGGVAETSQTTSSQAWLDAVKLEKTSSRSLNSAVTDDPDVTVEINDAETLSWHPTAYLEPDGRWTEAIRVISGSRLLSTTVVGPAVLSYRGRCFDKPSPSQSLQKNSKSFWENVDGEVEVLGHEMVASLDGTPALRIVENATQNWQDAFLHIPEGPHLVTFELIALVQESFGQKRIPATSLTPQGWVDDLELISLPDHFDRWMTSHGLPSGTLPANDADGDGSTNELEYRSGSDPNNPQSRPAGLRFASSELDEFYIYDPKPALMLPYIAANSGAILEASNDLVNWQNLDGPLLHEPPLYGNVLPITSTATDYRRLIDEVREGPFFRLRFPPIE